MFKKLSFLVTAIFVVFGTFISVFADPDPIDRLREEMQSSTAQDIGWGILSPALKIVGIIFFVLGIIAIVISVFYLVIRGIKMLFGRGVLGKSEIGRAFTVLIIGVLISGGSWIGIVSLSNRVIVQPVSNEIIESNSVNNKDTGKTKQTEEKQQDAKDTNDTEQ